MLHLFTMSKNFSNTESFQPLKKNIDPKITEYDAGLYDYSGFWKNRQYEHEAELIVLKRIYSKLPYRNRAFVLDLGASYGRLFDTYKLLGKHKIILDYSTLALENAVKRLGTTSDVHFVAANIYHLPFQASSIELAQMIRVFHHLEDQALAMKEINRVLTRDAHFVIEFPNKWHLKNLAKSIFNPNFRKNLSEQDAYHIPSDGSREGLPEGASSIFLSYGLKHITKVLEQAGFSVERRFGASILRSSFLKKHVSLNLLLAVESLYQILSPIALISPSIFLDTRNTTKRDSQIPDSFENLLVCPKCHSNLGVNNDTIICTQCHSKFKKIGQIYDLRYPRPTGK